MEKNYLNCIVFFGDSGNGSQVKKGLSWLVWICESFSHTSCTIIHLQAFKRFIMNNVWIRLKIIWKELESFESFVRYPLTTIRSGLINLQKSY